MNRPASPPSAVGLSVHHLFKDIYRLLENFQETTQKIGSISTHIARCQHELSSLEKIHANRWRFHSRNQDSFDDPFQLRETLNRFAVSCNALKYINSPLAEVGDDIPDGCGFPVNLNLKRSWRKKHLKSLENEFFGHERSLSLALSNAVYTTVLQMQRSTMTYELSLAQILRRAERRHHIFECLDCPIRSTDRSKLENFRLEEMDWELSLRRYMDHIETWTNDSSETVVRSSTSRSSTFSSQSSGQEFKRRNSNVSVHSGYSEHRMSGELDTSIFYRPARRNSLHGDQNYENENGRTSSLSSNHSNSSTALVLYNSQSPQSSSTVLSRPVKRASISRDFHWEYVGRSSTFGMLAPLAAQHPELKDAQADIFTQTQGMTSSEARAYAQGRLASLPQAVTDEVKTILSLQGQNRKSLQNHNQIDEGRGRTKSHRSTTELKLDLVQVSNKKRSTSIDSSGPKSPTSQQVRQSMNALEVIRQNKSRSDGRKDLGSAPKTAKKFKAKIRDLRPMTAISERSVFSKSRASSMDRPSGSRSIMQAFAARKSSLSIETPPVPELQNVLENFVPEIPPVVPEEDQKFSEPTIIKRSKSSPKVDKPRLKGLDSKSTPSLKSTDKPLPPGPGTKFNKSTLLAIFKPRSNKDLLAPPLPTNGGGLQSRVPSNHSMESLRSVSMELLKRRDSKMTLFSVAEGLDVPFDMWLRALPYIEGRASTPRPPVQESSTL